MEVFIAPQTGQTKTVTPAIVKTLLKNYDAHVKRDGRIECGSGHLLTELPKLNATEHKLAIEYGITYERIQAHTDRLDRAEARAKLDDSVNYVEEIRRDRDAAWQRFWWMSEMIDNMYAGDHLRAAAIKTAAGFTY